MCVCVGIVVVASEKITVFVRLAFGQEWGGCKRTVSGQCENGAIAGIFQEHVSMATSGRREAQG